jgi:aspartate kinase
VALLVQKFGGTSVGSTDRIEAVAELIIRSVQAGHKVIAVVSAMAGETNRLLGLAQQIDPRAASRELDVLAATGEQVTIALLAMALIKRGYPAVSLLADQISINTDNKFGKARILSVDSARLAAELEQGHIVVAAGFQGRDFEGNVTTLGRGGSDTSAVAIAAAVKADECQIFTDVDGVYSIDPRICSGAKRLPYIPFTDMLELASLGAKVLHSRSVEYAGRFQVPLRVLSTFRPDAGTLMVFEDIPMQMPVISGIACQHGVTFIECSGLTASSLTQLMQSLAKLNVEADMVQQQGTWPNDLKLCWTVADTDWPLVADELNDLAKNNLLKFERNQQNLAKLSVIGSGIKSQPDLVAKIFTVLEQMNIQIWLVTQAETRFSVLMPPELIESVAARLHQSLVTAEN